MRVPLAALVGVVLCAGVAGCGRSSDAPATPAGRTPLPAPEVTLTAEEKQVWAPTGASRGEIPVLLYHGIGPTSGFDNAADASYGIGQEDFAKQMAEIQHAGYQTVGLQDFLDFVAGKPVALPPRPLLLTFDDARADSWTGGDEILRKLHLRAVMFVDVGRVDAGDPEYMTWPELQAAQTSGRWELQLHSGEGHVKIHYGSGPDDYGPYYAYEDMGEDFGGWRKRVRSDVESGQATLAGHIPAYHPLAFAPPYGSYGQEGTNDPRIPDDLLGWLTDRYPAVFTQDENALAHSASKQPLGRIEVTRATTGGELHELLQTGGR